MPAPSCPTPASLNIAAAAASFAARKAAYTPPCEPLTITAPAAFGPTRVTLSAMTMGASMGLSLCLGLQAAPRTLQCRADAGDDTFSVREDVVLQDRTIRNWHLQRTDPADWGL